MLREKYFAPLLEEAVRGAKEQLGQKIPRDFSLRTDIDDAGSEDDGLPLEHETQDDTPAWLEVYNADVLLPLSYVQEVLVDPVLKEVVNLELECRRAEASRALEDVRTAIIRSEVLKMNKRFVTGKSLTTRTQSQIQAANNEVRKVANLYRRHWVALIVLGMDRRDPVYRPLTKKDVVKFVFSSDAPELGKSERAESWIWENVSWGDATDSDDSRYQEFFKDGGYIPMHTAAICDTDVQRSPSGPLVLLKRNLQSLERGGSDLRRRNAPMHALLLSLLEGVAGGGEQEGAPGRGRCRWVCKEVSAYAMMDLHSVRA